jgi:YD repeat-containing protein
VAFRTQGPRALREETYQYDGYSNATQIAVAATDGFVKTTTNTYTNNATNWFLGRLTNASVTSTITSPGSAPPLTLSLAWSGGALAQTSATRASSFAYDAASGLLTQEVIEPGTPALRLQTDYTYNVFGQKTQVTVSCIDITTRSASTTYDAQGQFATSSTNALGQSESWQYDARFGLPTSHTGPNGLTTTWTYDTFGRKTLEVRADGTRTAWSYQFCSGVVGGTAGCPAPRVGEAAAGALPG